MEITDKSCLTLTDVKELSCFYVHVVIGVCSLVSLDRWKWQICLVAAQYYNISVVLFFVD